MSDVPSPVVSVRGAAVEPERFVSVKPEVQAGLGQQSHDPSAQRTYTEELRREPITDKYDVNSFLFFILARGSLHGHVLYINAISHAYTLPVFVILCKSIGHVLMLAHILEHILCARLFLVDGVFFLSPSVIPSLNEHFQSVGTSCC